MSNPVFETLCDLGVCAQDAVETVQTFVRDRDDVPVLRCRRSGVIFLARTDHMDMAHYEAKPPTHRAGVQKRAIINTNDDTQRRYARYANLIRAKRWLDIGAGSGAVLDALGPLAADYAGVEPQAIAAGFLGELGHPVYRRLDAVKDASFDVVTLFHVFEHVQDPLALLRDVVRLLVPGGRLIIEVPHARDFLISFVDCPAFRAHTFWSEHLLLHTRESLRALVAHAGLDVLGVEGVQRYPLANHLYWLAEGKAAGHLTWNLLTDERLDQSWGDVLARLDMTDTLVLEARRPA